MLSAIRCSIGQLAPHNPRWRCHRMHHTVFGIEDVHDLDATHAERISDHRPMTRATVSSGRTG
jgi:hypothetical protein